MAIYHLSAKVGSRSTGQSAAAKHDYISREGRYSEDRHIDQRELVYVESGMMPEWAAEKPSLYWQAADLHERANGRLFQQVEFALPRELSREAQIELAREFANEITGTKHGFLPYTLAVHAGKGENPHAHLMMSERVHDGSDRTPETWFKRAATGDKARELGGAKKTDAFQSREWIDELRESWAQRANAALEREGKAERIDHRSYAAQGIEQVPTIHEGPNVREMERRGLMTDRVAHNVEVRAVNAELADIRTQSAIAQQQLRAMLAEHKTEHKSETKERETEVAAFLKEHRKDFTTAPQAKGWFEREAVRLAKLENPMTARAMYERQWARPLETAKRTRNDAVLRLDLAKTAVAEHRDPRSLWQKLLRRPDEELGRLQQHHELAKKDYWKTEAAVQKVESKWTGQQQEWSKLAADANAPRLALQREEAQRLEAIRPHVLRECERRDADPVVQQRRADASHLNYIVSELRNGTAPDEIRDLLLKWRLPNIPEAAKDADRLMAAGMKAHERERGQIYRELGITPPEQKRSGPKIVWKKSRGQGGIERD